MKTLIVIVVMALAISKLLNQLARKKRARAHADDWRFGDTPSSKEKKRTQYQRKFELLNKSEQVLFNRLREAEPDKLVFSQVSMSQIFFIGNFRKDGYRQIGEIGRKSVDFLLCNPDTSIVLAIELNGPHHSKWKQMTSDDKKRKALEEAGIPLMVIPASEIPGVDELRQKIAAAMSPIQEVKITDLETRKEPSF